MKSSRMTANGYGSHGKRKMNDETEPLGATPGNDTSGLIRVNLTTPAARNAAGGVRIDPQISTVRRIYEGLIRSLLDAAARYSIAQQAPFVSYEDRRAGYGSTPHGSDLQACR